MHPDRVRGTKEPVRKPWEMLVCGSSILHRQVVAQRTPILELHPGTRAIAGQPQLQHSLQFSSHLSRKTHTENNLTCFRSSLCSASSSPLKPLKSKIPVNGDTSPAEWGEGDLEKG